MSVTVIKRLAGDPLSKVEVFVSCKSLKDKDILSKSDSCCVLFVNKAGNWVEYGRTEVIPNNLNPQFTQAFVLDYYFETVQALKFSIYDIDNKSPKLTDDDFLGSIECTLGEIVSNNPLTRPLQLSNKPNAKTGKSTITLRAQEVSKMCEVIMMQFTGQKLEKKDFLSKSDPFLEFNRLMPDGTFQVVYRTEHVKNDSNPKWRPISVKASQLCGGDYKTLIRVDCLDYESNGSHDLIGSFETSVEELIRGSTVPLKWDCINPKKKAKKKSYENSGIISLLYFKVSKDYSFLDYIYGGLQINFTVGIDFTASNGDPSNPSSMHYIDKDQPNHYMRAVKSVGEVIKDYDSDQMFPALGYGAKIPPNMEVSQSFAINFNASNPFCSGVQGILDAYCMCINRVQLYGPTNFAPIILHVAQFAAAAQKESSAKNYFVLLIITDGVISDMSETIRALVYASSLPFSVIIIGVGSADFKAMDALDCDEGLLKDDTGNEAKRDIVQFVPFRDFEYGSPETFARHVLMEIPDQVCRYYSMNNIAPSARSANISGGIPYSG